MTKRVWMPVMGVVVVTGLTGCELEWDRRFELWDFAFVHPIIALLHGFHRGLGNYGSAIVAGTLLFRLVVVFILKGLKRIRIWRGKSRLHRWSLRWRTVPFLPGVILFLLQLPVMVALYQVVIGDPEVGNSRFLWLVLKHPDPFFLLPLAAGWTTTWTGWRQPAEGRHLAGQVGVALVVFACALGFPSALALYWLTSSAAIRLRQWVQTQREASGNVPL
ncbi:hypothetical protein CEN49_00540 [Fischerella thermalis CCMEE 5273]|nr:hypothetical protein CEN49_00540 [Fischerella thermalis CCMEE 5273]